VRNQSVLLNGVNDKAEDLSNLIGTLASMNIQPVSTIYACRSLGIADALSTTSISVTWCVGSRIFVRR
jgi:L-lysine 2,3-aminomutase